MQRALDSAIGLPRRSTSALWMLGFLTPADVRRYLMLPLLADVMRAKRLLPIPLRMTDHGTRKYYSCPSSSTTCGMATTAGIASSQAGGESSAMVVIVHPPNRRRKLAKLQ